MTIIISGGFWKSEDGGSDVLSEVKYTMSRIRVQIYIQTCLIFTGGRVLYTESVDIALIRILEVWKMQERGYWKCEQKHSKAMYT